MTRSIADDAAGPDGSRGVSAAKFARPERSARWSRRRGTTGIGAVDPLPWHPRTHRAEVTGSGCMSTARTAAFIGCWRGRTVAHRSGTGRGGVSRDRQRATATWSIPISTVCSHTAVGAVLFREPAVGRFYRHDSPYTYFTRPRSCISARSASNAPGPERRPRRFWATLQCFPLESETGIGAILHKTRAAAVRWAELIAADDRLRLVVEPELDVGQLLSPSGWTRSPRLVDLSPRNRIRV